MNSKEILDILKKLYPKCSYITNVWKKLMLYFVFKFLMIDIKHWHSKRG